MNTTRMRPRVSAMRLAMRAMPDSWSASATSDTSLVRSRAMASLSAPALRNPQTVEPVAGLLEHGKELRIRRQRRHHVRLTLMREPQHEPVGSVCSEKCVRHPVEGTM